MPDRSRAANALTIMMTDVVGSTELRRARGDQDADGILALQAAIVQLQVAAFGGRVRKSLGDGFLISFPSDGRGPCRRGDPACVGRAQHR